MKIVFKWALFKNLKEILFFYFLHIVAKFAWKLLEGGPDNENFQIYFDNHFNIFE